jgi:tRNA(adenine34) deaminase
VRSLAQICDDPRLNHRVELCPGVLAEPAGALLRAFFRRARARARATPGADA